MVTIVLAHPVGAIDAGRLGLPPGSYDVGDEITVNEDVARSLTGAGYVWSGATTPVPPPGGRVYALRAAAWQTGLDYIPSELVVNAGALYRCTTAHTAGGTFAAANFTAIGGGGGGGSTVSVDADGTLTVNGTTVEVATDTEVGALIAAVTASRAPTLHVHSADDVTSGVLPVTQGGTGGETVAAARTGLGLGTVAVMTPAQVATDPALAGTFARRQPGAVTTTPVALPFIDVGDYNPTADNTLHLLSERYGTLAAAQAVYPHVTSLTQSIDWAALQAAVNAASTGNGIRRIAWDKGTLVVNDRITLTNRGYWIGGQSKTRGTTLRCAYPGPLFVWGADISATRADGAITAGSSNLTGSGFTGQVGKYISIPGAGTGGSALSAKIATVTDDTHCVLNTPAITTVATGGVYTVDPWDGVQFDGMQGFFLSAVTLSTLGGTTPLANGGGDYLVGSTAIMDWRGGDVHLDQVSIEGFETGFWGIQSDVNSWRDVELIGNKLGAYIGPRSDQFSFDAVYTHFNDRVFDIDRCQGVRFKNCQFVGDGTDTSNPIRIRSRWGTGSSGVSFDSCWFEHVQGFATAEIEAFIEVGVGDLVTSTDIHVRNPLILNNAAGALPRAKFLIKCDRGDSISVDNPAGQFWKNVDGMIKFVGASGVSPSALLRGRHALGAAAFTVTNTGAGSPSVTIEQWGAGGVGGAINFGNANLAAGNATLTGPAHTVGSSGNTGTDVALRAAAGNARSITFQSGTTARWIARANNTAEGGSNAGSDFELVARDDAGANLASAITAVRATGQVRFAYPVKVKDYATAGRPAAATAGVGAMYYDTTILKPVWSDGTVWRLADGSAA
jgi:hypothetical protein